MINNLTKRERESVAKDHVDVIREQGVAFNKYMNDRFFRGDFPNENEQAYTTSVIEELFEDTMMLVRSIASPSVGSCYESILQPSLRMRPVQFRRISVIPIIYRPAINDVVTLPVHLMIQAAKHDNRIDIVSNWQMRVVKIIENNPYIYEYKMPNAEDSKLLVDKVKIRGVGLKVAPLESPDEPFNFPTLPMNHFILLKPAKEELYDSIRQ